MSKHTPGPWTLKATTCGIGCCDDIQEVYAQYPGDDEPIRQIASVDGGNAVWLREGEAEANDRLIAAAPSLLEACQAAESGLTDAMLGGDEEYARMAVAYAQGVINQLRAAIRKAIGEP